MTIKEFFELAGLRCGSQAFGRLFSWMYTLFFNSRQVVVVSSRSKAPQRLVATCLGKNCGGQRNAVKSRGMAHCPNQKILVRRS